MAARGQQQPSLAAVRIGVTGHRRHRLKVADRTLLNKVLDVVELVRRAKKLKSTEGIEIVSALAEGADEIAARAALKSGCRLTALLPFSAKAYEATFSDKAYKTVFRDLLKRANERIVLPGSLDDATAGYTAVGAETLTRSDIVLTIWDGAPAQGRGGAPEILQLALERRLPIVWIDASEDQQLRLIQRKAFGPCPRLHNIARRAKPIEDLSQALSDGSA